MTGPSSRRERQAAEGPEERPGTGAGPSGDAPAGLVIRPLSGLAEREACVALQERVWGDAFADRVPASVLMIALETGGVASGAFLGGRLVGFVFGITGLRGGRPIHWSDMLAVAPEHRGEGIGFRLKLHQRALLLERDVEAVRWTFDPLEARNAHLNLRRLGAVTREYRRDLYGASDSPLHAGIGTDRLLVEWPIASTRVMRRLAHDGPAGAGPAPADAAPGERPAPDDAPRGVVLNPPESTDPLPRPGSTLSEPTRARIRIAIPADIQALKRTDLGVAVAWRSNVRAAFERAFAAGYTAVDAEREDVGPPAGAAGGAAGAVVYYVLTRGFSR